jgi:hypothetical protein
MMVLLSVRRIRGLIEIDETSYSADHKEEGKTTGTKVFQSAGIDMVEKVWHKGFIGMRVVSIQIPQYSSAIRSQ